MRGIVGLHSKVKSQQEISEVKSQSYSVGSSKLLVEFIELEHTSRLILIVMYRPDVAGVGKQCTFHYPEQFGPVLHAEVEPDVTALIDEVGHRVLGIVATRAKSSYAPSAHTVGTSGKESLLKGKH